MSFEMLRGRLMEHLRASIQNGELTERGLARLSGISQPHIHNVLKGVKSLSQDLEDQILSTLRISILDLFSMDELRMHLDSGGGPFRYRALPVLDGLLGPDFPMPFQSSHGEMQPVESSLLDEVFHARLARLGGDPEMLPCVQPNQLVLLDYSETARLSPKPFVHYAMRIGGKGMIRILIKDGAKIFAATERTRQMPELWLELPHADDPLSVVLARVVWLGHA